MLHGMQFLYHFFEVQQNFDKLKRYCYASACAVDIFAAQNLT